MQPDAGHTTRPSYSIASTARTPVDAGMDTPGAKYDTPSFHERQPSARQRNARTMKFSRYSRFADLEREMRNNTVPGPGYYG